MILATLPPPTTKVLGVLSHAERVDPLKVRCSVCNMRELCLPSGMATTVVAHLDELRFAIRHVKARELLFVAGERFQHIYAIRTGTLKSSLSTAEGQEQISGFHYAGELIGFDGLASGLYASSATALETTEVCAIHYESLLEFSLRNAEMQRQINRLMGQEIVRENSLLLLLGSMSAEQRLAVFLLNISKRMRLRGYSPEEFHLRMSRADMGSYLGMKLETVSRTFSRFQEYGILDVEKKHIHILDFPALQAILK